LAQRNTWNHEKKCLQPSANYKDSRLSTKERKHVPLFTQTFETIRIIKIKILYDDRKVDGNHFPLFKAKFDNLSEREIKNVSDSL
jgi:hypothetical protein